ncbi:MAG: hypothetical protein GX571_13280 [Lentisphaerae bacterium]|jgi:hypothetical protein|nr:hypothetical protein [Lentisphaerota bacterium]
MQAPLPYHLTSGDCAAANLRAAGLPGTIHVWHDVLYEGTHEPGWPCAETLCLRARMLEEHTGGGVSFQKALKTLRNQYADLRAAADRSIVLWFDACLFDQTMLVHLLACLRDHPAGSVSQICIDSAPGLTRYNGLGELPPSSFAAHYPLRVPVTPAMFSFATEADTAFGHHDGAALRRLANLSEAPLPHVPPAAARRLLEFPDPETGLGRLEQLVLQAIDQGVTKPTALFRAVADLDTPPQYWGDTTLWHIVNGLALRRPPLVHIGGPTPRLPQWPGQHDYDDYVIERVR